MGLEIRPGICAADSTSAATTDRTMALGRDGRGDPGKAVLSLACRGQRRRSLGFPDSVPQEHEGRDSVMRKLLKKQGFAPSTIVTDKLRSYGSAIRKLGLCADMSRAYGRTIELKLPSAGTTTRAKDAALQIAKVCPEIPRHPRCRLQSLQRPAPPDFPPDASPISHLSHGGMAGNNNGRLTNAIGKAFHPPPLS